MKKHTEEITKKNSIAAILKAGEHPDKIAEILNVSRASVYRWKRQFNKEKSLKRRANPLSGRRPKLCGENARKVIKLLLKPATKFGYDTDFWTTKRIVDVIKKQLKISVSQMTIHRILIKYEQSYKLPRTRFYEADPKKQKEWISETVPKIKRKVSKYRAILYFEDESNISLTPTVAKTWSKKGSNIVKTFTGNRGSVSAISAISNDGKLIFNVHSGNKRYGAADIKMFLQQMLEHHPKRHLVVVMDQAPCHKSKLVAEFVLKQKRLHLFFLPPRSPEFNPDEKVWNHLKNQELKSHGATTIKELKKITKAKLSRISSNKKIVRGIFRMSDVARIFNK